MSSLRLFALTLFLHLLAALFKIVLTVLQPLELDGHLVLPPLELLQLFLDRLGDDVDLVFNLYAQMPIGEAEGCFLELLGGFQLELPQELGRPAVAELDHCLQVLLR